MVRSKNQRLMSEINVVPYIDVMLVLLIIFMITAPLLTQGIEVDLPNASAEPLEADQEQDYVVLSVDRDGQFYLNIGDNQDAPLDDATVLERLTAVINRDPTTQVVVKGDENVPYGRVVIGASLIQQSGATKVGFLTDPASIDDRR